MRKSISLTAYMCAVEKKMIRIFQHFNFSLHSFNNLSYLLYLLFLLHLKYITLLPLFLSFSKCKRGVWMFKHYFPKKACQKYTVELII